MHFIKIPGISLVFHFSGSFALTFVTQDVRLLRKAAPQCDGKDPAHLVGQLTAPRRYSTNCYPKNISKSQEHRRS